VSRTFAAFVVATSIVAGQVSFTSAASRYTIAEVLPAGRNQPPTVPSRSNWGSAVRLAPTVLSWIADAGLSRRVDRELERLRPEIDRQLRPGTGVLIVVGFQESKVPDVNGYRSTTLLDAYVAGAGASAPEVVERFLDSDRLDRGAMAGFVRRDAFLWVTR
jgi:hypothetical protein